jgi:hypothetical protein
MSDAQQNQQTQADLTADPFVDGHFGAAHALDDGPHTFPGFFRTTYARTMLERPIIPPANV